ncbi:hypothetical protein [Micromonospora sp. NPDC051296]|uniref:hypothetical protein n=1 Tax=Micromonospora sp. NPDC051296 TaxID=3155046 RepID=UPI00343B1D1E
MSAFVTAGATWTAASAGFAEAPSRFQLVMSIIAAALTGGMVAFGPNALVSLADLKKFLTCKDTFVFQPCAWAPGASQKTMKLRLGL